MNKLGGLGRGANTVQKMTYKSAQACTELEVANLMASYVEDSFQPFNDTDFDYDLFRRIEQEWDSAQENRVRMGLRSKSSTSDHLPPSPTFRHWAFTPKIESPVLRQTPYEEMQAGVSNSIPNPTKHQQQTWDIQNLKMYKSKKTQPPYAPQPNVKVW